jgi:hypothetical protein
MAEPLLGCPHCGKPVGFAAAMAGKVVACPHCRGPFQMPEGPPAAAPDRPGRPSRPDDRGLDFGDERAADPGGGRVRAELDSYRSVATLATVFALVGAAGVLIGLGLVIQALVLPVFRGTDDRAGAAGVAVLWLVSSLVFAAATILGLFLVRSCVLVGVDAARTLRALERHTVAGPKPK